MRIDEIFDKLIGNIKVTGDEFNDELVLNNLSTAEVLLLELINDMMYNASQVASHKSSVQKVAKHSYNYLQDIKTELDDTLLNAKKQLFKDEIQTPKITQIIKETKGDCYSIICDNDYSKLRKKRILDSKGNLPVKDK